MTNLQIEGVTVRQLMAMGDGLLGQKEWKLAQETYKVAFRHAAPSERQSILTRIGLAQTPGARTPLMLSILKEIEGAGLANPFVSDGMATWMKTLPFAEDERFTAISSKHAGLLPIANWQWNLQTVLWAVLRNRSVPGDYVELGVFKGHTSLFCADYCDFQGWPKTWWLFDTFDGIPDDQLAPGWDKINQGLYKGTYSYEEVRNRFAGFNNFKVIQGRVPDILLQDAPERIAFLHIDMNNAPAEIGALEVLFDRLSPGAIIIFDDYTWASTHAQFVAEKAWFAERGHHILPLPTGQGVFVNP